MNNQDSHCRCGTDGEQVSAIRSALEQACTGSLPSYPAVRHDYPVSAAPSLSSANAWSAAPKCPSAPSSSA
jgi:hypothetical protein